MRNELLATTGLAMALLLGPSAANAATQVASIYGVYDAACGSNVPDCSFGTGYTVNTNGGSPSDSPALFIVNPTTSPFTNVTITLSGYQGLNNGKVATLTTPDIASHTVYELIWGGATSSFSQPGGGPSLFAYDYDDEYGHTTSNSACASVGQSLCARVGNFDVNFSALLNGNPISSSFSPDNTQGGGNQQHAFVGWEGLDPNGFSESIYDNHSGAESGVLAFIFTGTNGQQNVPEPATLSLLGAGIGALALGRRRRRRS